MTQRSILLRLLLLAALAGPVARPALAATPADAGAEVDEFQVVETQSYRASLDGHGNLRGLYVKRFEDDLLRPRYWPQKGGEPSISGLIFGPIGNVPRDASPITTITTGGGFLTIDPSGKLLPAGLELERTYRFRQDGFLIDLDLVLRNTTAEPISLKTSDREIGLWIGPVLPDQTYGYPAVVSHQEKAGLVEQSPDRDIASVSGVDWIAARGYYYAAVLDEQSGRGSALHQWLEFHDKDGTSRQSVLVGFRYQYPDIRSHEEVKLSFTLYLGPKLEQHLAEGGYESLFDNWNGLTGGIGKLMFSMLGFFHGLTRSWGVAILLLTFAVKLLLHPLNLKQLRSMEKLKVLQPKMAELKKRYEDDTKKFQEEVQRLYIEHKVNPLGGCLPILLQIPIFIALYQCLLSAIELKRVPFLWLPDLAKPDPTAVLPILFAGSIYVSSKLTTSPEMDKSQQTVMQIMPIMMLVLMVNVPGGVMLYLAGQSVLSLFETRYNQRIMRREDEDKEARRAERSPEKKKKSKKPKTG